MLDPLKMTGDVLVDIAAYDGNMNEQETWILLPKQADYITNSSGNYQAYSLPVGWQVTIIYAMVPDHMKELYVSTQETYTYGNNVIMDTNRNMNQYINLTDGNQDSDTFVWTGLFWKCLHDPQ